MCFSPREGIWLVETQRGNELEKIYNCFSPREGIWLVETLLLQSAHFHIWQFQSP